MCVCVRVRVCVNSISSIKMPRAFAEGIFLFINLPEQYEQYISLRVWVLRDVDFKNPGRARVRVRGFRGYRE